MKISFVLVLFSLLVLSGCGVFSSSSMSVHSMRGSTATRSSSGLFGQSYEVQRTEIDDMQACLLEHGGGAVAKCRDEVRLSLTHYCVFADRTVGPCPLPE